MEIVADYRRLRTFRQDSKLYQFLVNRKSDLIKKGLLFYRFSTIKLALDLIIRRDKLYDLKNPEVIVCDRDLEDALDVQSYHFTESHGLIEPHLLKAKSTDSLTSSRLCLAEINRSSELFKNSISFPTSILGNNFDVTAEYYVHPHLMDVVRSTDLFNNRSSVYPYRHIVHAISRYILSKKHEFFDLRNIRIANITNDPLSKAFNVNYLCSFQTNLLIKSNLKLVRRSKRLKRLTNCCRFCI